MIATNTDDLLVVNYLMLSTQAELLHTLCELALMSFGGVRPIERSEFAKRMKENLDNCARSAEMALQLSDGFQKRVRARNKATEGEA